MRSFIKVASGHCQTIGLLWRLQQLLNLHDVHGAEDMILALLFKAINISEPLKGQDLWLAVESKFPLHNSKGVHTDLLVERMCGLQQEKNNIITLQVI